MSHRYCLLRNDAMQGRTSATVTARRPGMGRPGMGRPGMGRPGMGRPGMGRPGMGRPAKTLAPMALLLGALLASPAGAQTLPAGGQVVHGAASIGVDKTNHRMTIDQKTPKAILDWTSFDIGSGAAVHFKQKPGDIALNRVRGKHSQIDGHLSANGQVWLVNPKGVVFGKGSQVNVGGLVASTLDIANEDFHAGRHVFTRGAAQGSITNHGEIAVADGGLLALLAPTVKNEGYLGARLGSVVLAGGDRVTLQAGADGWLEVAVDPSTMKTLIENQQLIEADGGQVVMTTRAADALSGGMVSNTGMVQARTLAESQGRILLLGDMHNGEVVHSGVLDAGAPEGGRGGFVETSAAVVTLPAGREVTTHAPNGPAGVWLLDAGGCTIAANGGDISGAQLSADLAANNVIINTTTDGSAGDIDVNDAVRWSANQLTLDARHSINVNARMQIDGDGTLALSYGGTVGDTRKVPLPGSNFDVQLGKGHVGFGKGGTGLLEINGHGYEVIRSVPQLQGIGADGRLGGRYVLGGSLGIDGFPLEPIGTTPEKAFTGSFDGLGHTIHGLEIDLPDRDGVGLFGHATNATLRNLKLEGARVEGGSNVGALVGSHRADGGVARISNVQVCAKVRGGIFVGGLAGENSAENGGVARITNAHSRGRVSGESVVGGLAGANASLAGSEAGIDHASSASAVVGEQDSIGGLVGMNQGQGMARISHAHATGPVLGDLHVGGLVGDNTASSGGTASISHAHANGQVAGAYFVGGLVGENLAISGGTSRISHAHATGNVSGTEDVGGLAGSHSEAGGTASISEAYAEGNVSGDSRVGGLIGRIHDAALLPMFHATGDVHGNEFEDGLVGQYTESVNRMAVPDSAMSIDASMPMLPGMHP